MAITTCPHCTSKLTIGDDLLGREVECGSCGRVFAAAADAPRGPARDPWAGTEPAPARRRSRDEDEDDDRPRRRRRRRDDDEDDREWAEDQVRQPATMLQVVGWWGVFTAVLSFGVAIVMPIVAINAPKAPPPGGFGGGGGFGPGGGGFGPGPGNPPPGLGPQEEAMISAISYGVGGAVSLVISVVILIGAARMKRLESRGLALTAAYLAMIPCFSPCCLLGLPFGINAVNAMNKPGVREFFDEADRGD